MKRSLSVILLLVSLAACTSDRSPVHGFVDSSSAGALAGRWQWDESCNGWGVCSNPISTGHSEMIAFLDEAQFAEYVDGRLSSSSTFRVTTETGSNNEEVTMLAITNRPGRYLVDLTGDSLALLEECIDCGVHRYHRITE